MSEQTSTAAPEAQSTGGGADLHIVDVTKKFGSFTAVDDLTLTVPSGSFFALLGPSGCGKTTTLRMVAGLEEPTAGRIVIGTEDVTYRKPFKRPVNTVFQSYALFPHLDIFENVAFGLRRTGMNRSEIRGEVENMLELVELSTYARRKPNQLSGGQQQRVAVARALINKPEVLLLDEPLGALDLKLRRQMQIELKRIQTEVGITFVHVTHDQEEAMTMADTIAVMNEGRIEQMGAPIELYENPVTTFVANFLGQSNLIKGSVTGKGGGDALLEVQGIRMAMPTARVHSDRDDVWVGVRPEKMQISRSGISVNGENAVTGVVTDASYIGVSTQYLVELPWGQEVGVFAQNLSTEGPLSKGDEVVLHWNPAHTFALDASQDAEAGAEKVEGDE
ncbi:MAG TPA: ABC transporter ATP-binding protein [Actinomycetes bacterium]|nr:ABC transporter ATP-binding protein [Actinomycetes bacterium]